MSPRTASGKPFPYQSKHNDDLHHGNVAVDASTTVDLGLGHNNFDVVLGVRRQAPVGAPSKVVEWAYGTEIGTFILTGAYANPKSSEQIAAVRLVTVAALPAYTQSGAGAAATLTADAVGVLTVDGVDSVISDRILVKDGAAGEDNGIYEHTTEGTVGVAFILTRVTDHDTDAEVTNGDWCLVTAGNSKTNKGFVITTADAITVDTTAVVWAEFDNEVRVTFLAVVSDAAS